MRSPDDHGELSFVVQELCALRHQHGPSVAVEGRRRLDEVRGLGGCTRVVLPHPAAVREVDGEDLGGRGGREIERRRLRDTDAVRQDDLVALAAAPVLLTVDLDSEATALGLTDGQHIPATPTRRPSRRRARRPLGRSARPRTASSRRTWRRAASRATRPAARRPRARRARCRGPREAREPACASSSPVGVADDGLGWSEPPLDAVEPRREQRGRDQVRTRRPVTGANLDAGPCSTLVRHPAEGGAVVVAPVRVRRREAVGKDPLVRVHGRAEQRLQARPRARSRRR